MNKTILFISHIVKVVAFILLAASCTEKVNLDPHERGIVVYAMMEDSTVQQVKLFYTSYLSETYYPPVEEAEVYMEKMEGEEAVERYDFHKKEDGLWEADLYPQQLAYYRLTVIVPGNDVITATTQFPTRNDWTGVNYPITESKSIETINTPQSVDKPAMASEHKCYICRLFSFMDYIPESNSHELSPFIWHCDPCMEDNDSHWKFETWLFEDYDYRGPYAIQRDYFNIDNSDDKAKTIALFDMGNVCIIGGARLSYIGRYYYYYKDLLYTIHPLSYIVVRNVNVDYELYFKSVIANNLGLNKIDVSDLTHIWDKDEIYSNVHNGVGIFAAECRYELMVKDWQYMNIPPVWEQYDLIIPGWND